MSANKSGQLECIIPILPVRDLARSLDFYLTKLGFTLDWRAADNIGSVSRDGHCIMLMRRDPFVAPACVWIGLETDLLFHEFRASGVKVAEEPRNFSWAYETEFEDIDGNILWLGTDPPLRHAPEDAASA